MYPLIKLLTFVMLTLALTLSSLTAIAKSSKENKGNSSNKESKSQSNKSNTENNDDDFSININFSTNDKKIITDYFHDNNYKASALPPGIEKNLARGKPLPPGIAKNKIPDNLASSLHISAGHNYLMVGNNVVKINTATGIVEDIIENITD